MSHAAGDPSFGEGQARGAQAPRDANSSGQRDTVLVLGGPGAGKTVWIARLLDALRTPTSLLDGRIPDGETWIAGRGATTLQIDFTDNESKRRNEALITSLEAKSWPIPTLDAVEHVVDFTLTGEGIRTPRRRLILVDLPGSALLAAFAPSNPSTLTIGWTVGNQLARTAAVVLLIDPVRATERSRESIDLANATVAMLEHLRASPEGRSIPIAIVLSKCDRGYKTIMREGGVRRFAERHLGPVLEAAGSARVYISSATRSRLVSPGYREPSTRRPVENLVEPMHFLLRTLDRIDSIRARSAKRRPLAERTHAASRVEMAAPPHRGAPVSRAVIASLIAGAAVMAVGAIRFATARPLAPT
ncbi:MAG: hypothetical protein ACKO3W_03430, partial [bacterium]